MTFREGAKRMSDNVDLLVGWFPPDEPPNSDRIVLVHIPELEPSTTKRGVFFGRYINGLAEWRIEGSPSRWIADAWAEVPYPSNAQAHRQEEAG